MPINFDTTLLLIIKLKEMKKKNLWKWLSVMMVATLGIFITSCNPEPELSVSTTDITLNGTSDYQKIAVTARHTDWTVEVLEGRDWLTAGKTNNMVNVSVKENPNKDSRKGSVQISATEDAALYHIIYVTQEGGSTKLSVSPENVSFSASGGEQNIQVTCNTEWSVRGGNDWLTVEKLNQKTIALSAKKNESSEKLETTITVSTDDGEGTKNVKVSIAASEHKLIISGLDAPFDATKGSITTAQILKITCNSEWVISGNPDWLSFEALNGVGNAEVRVWTSQANPSTDNRSATIKVRSGNLTEPKKVTQLAGLDANLSMAPNKMVTVADGMAFDYKYGSNVMFYHTCLFLPHDVDRLTDEEIINIMPSRSNRDTPDDRYVNWWRGLEPDSEYVLCLVGFDENGKHGALYKSKIKTKSDINQACAYIHDVYASEKYWEWETTINAFVTRYYQWVIRDEKLYGDGDACIAWFFKRAMEETPDDFPPYVQGSAWQTSRNGSNKCHIATWALDAAGNFSGIIDNFCGEISSSSKTIKKNYVEKDDCFRMFKTLK